MVGLDIPVRPMPRTTWYFECRAEIEPMPLTADATDGMSIGFRPEGAGFIAGISDYERAGDFEWEPDLDAFESEAWPRLARIACPRSKRSGSGTPGPATTPTTLSTAT